MSPIDASPKPFLIVLRYLAHILGLLLFGVYLLFYFGEGMQNGFLNPFTQSFSVQLQLFGIFICFVGIFAAWRLEFIGGLIVLSGIVLFYAVNYSVSGRWPGGPVFPVFYIVAALHLLCGWTIPFQSGQNTAPLKET